MHMPPGRQSAEAVPEEVRAVGVQSGGRGCACVHHSARMCYEIRYDMSPLDDPEERCECLCHQWDEDEEPEA